MISPMDILSRFTESKAGQHIVDELVEERQAQRRSWAGELAIAEREEAEALPPLRERRDKALTAVKAQQARLDAAIATYREADVAVSSASHTFAQRRSQLENQLNVTAAETIDAFIAELADEGERVRKSLTSSVGPRTWPTGRRGPGESNLGVVNATLDAIREARVEAAELKLQPLDDSEVAERLQALRRRVSAAWEGG